MAKKKKKKIKFTNLFLLIVLLYILVQVVIWTIGYFTKTMVLEEENIDLQIKKKAIVVMDETIIKANEDGIIKYNVEDGEKIKNDKSLFTISQSGQNEEISQKIDDLKNEINDLEKSKNSMNSNIILNKKEELKILENQKQKYYTENISPTSGIVSFEYDNDYEKVKLDKLDDINSNILDSLENNFIKLEETDGFDDIEKFVASEMPVKEMDSIDEEATVLLTSNVHSTGILLRSTDIENPVTIIPNGFPCIIGKSGKSSDYKLEEQFISRVHARIYEEMDGYYIEDLNSSNGTFVNGEKLKPHTQVMFQLGDIIMLADMEFVVE